MKFYQIQDGNYFEDGDASYGTLAEAKQAAKEIADEMHYPVEVVRVEIEMKRAAIIALANGVGWRKSREVVFTARPEKPRTDGARQRQSDLADA